MDLSYRSTISIYKSILEQFNPALENLVYLGNNYLRAFHALSKAAEVYFKAIEKIGEQALQSSTSHMLGEILMQMSDTQRLLSSDLEVVAQTFHVDLLQHMEKNSKMDVQFISENVIRLRSEMQAFVSESQREAELEEKRRYRFLAEKHQMLYNTLLQFYSRARGMIQTKAPRWKEQLEASRNPSNSHSQGLLSASHSQGYPSGRLTPTHLEMPPFFPTAPETPWGLCFFYDWEQIQHLHSRPSRNENVSSARVCQAATAEDTISSQYDPHPGAVLWGEAGVGSLWEEGWVWEGTTTLSDHQTSAAFLGMVRPVPRGAVEGKAEVEGLVPTGRTSRSGSFGEASSGSEGRKRNGTTRVQAIVPHTTGTNRTLLRFEPGDVIAVLRPEAQNGWLYGKLEGSSTCGWFPEAYVKPLENTREMEEPDTRGTNPFATVKLRPTVTNDRSAPIIR
ncbi:BAI1 associated protein 2 like 2 [Turdus rufiventris]|nr:BAI1 associated protein 2 like 2 [Turdus rufiventris]